MNKEHKADQGICPECGSLNQQPNCSGGLYPNSEGLLRCAACNDNLCFDFVCDHPAGCKVYEYCCDELANRSKDPEPDPIREQAPDQKPEQKNQKKSLTLDQLRKIVNKGSKTASVGTFKPSSCQDTPMTIKAAKTADLTPKKERKTEMNQQNPQFELTIKSSHDKAFIFTILSAANETTRSPEALTVSGLTEAEKNKVIGSFTDYEAKNMIGYSVLDMLQKDRSQKKVTLTMTADQLDCLEALATLKPHNPDVLVIRGYICHRHAFNTCSSSRILKRIRNAVKTARQNPVKTDSTEEEADQTPLRSVGITRCLQREGHNVARLAARIYEGCPMDAQPISIELKGRSCTVRPVKHWINAFSLLKQVTEEVSIDQAFAEDMRLCEEAERRLKQHRDSNKDKTFTDHIAPDLQRAEVDLELLEAEGAFCRVTLRSVIDKVYLLAALLHPFCPRHPLITNLADNLLDCIEDGDRTSQTFTLPLFVAHRVKALCCGRSSDMAVTIKAAKAIFKAVRAHEQAKGRAFTTKLPRSFHRNAYRIGGSIDTALLNREKWIQRKRDLRMSMIDRERDRLEAEQPDNVIDLASRLTDSDEEEGRAQFDRLRHEVRRIRKAQIVETSEEWLRLFSKLQISASLVQDQVAEHGLTYERILELRGICIEYVTACKATVKADSSVIHEACYKPLQGVLQDYHEWTPPKADQQPSGPNTGRIRAALEDAARTLADMGLPEIDKVNIERAQLASLTTGRKDEYEGKTFEEVLAQNSRPEPATPAHWSEAIVSELARIGDLLEQLVKKT